MLRAGVGAVICDEHDQRHGILQCFLGVEVLGTGGSGDFQPPLCFCREHLIAPFLWDMGSGI